MKDVQKSIRMSRQVSHYVEQYRGDSFADKFENMVLDFQERKGQIIEDWNRAQAMCDEKRKELGRLRAQIKDYENLHWKLRPLLDALEELLPK